MFDRLIVMFACATRNVSDLNRPADSVRRKAGSPGQKIAKQVSKVRPWSSFESALQSSQPFRRPIVTKYV